MFLKSFLVTVSSFPVRVDCIYPQNARSHPNDGLEVAPLRLAVRASFNFVRVCVFFPPAAHGGIGSLEGERVCALVLVFVEERPWFVVRGHSNQSPRLDPKSMYSPVFTHCILVLISMFPLNTVRAFGLSSNTRHGSFFLFLLAGSNTNTWSLLVLFFP